MALNFHFGRSNVKIFHFLRQFRSTSYTILVGTFFGRASVDVDAAPDADDAPVVEEAPVDLLDLAKNLDIFLDCIIPKRSRNS